MPIEIRAGGVADDKILARHYLALWRSYGTPDGHFRDDAEARIQAFIDEGRRSHGLGVFVATAGSQVAGSVACQLQLAPYPDVIIAAQRSHGYVWSVFVEADYRRLGIARRLMGKAIDHLESLGCTTAVLHSSDAGLRLYASLGFELAAEMRRDFPGPTEPQPEPSS